MDVAWVEFALPLVAEIDRGRETSRCLLRKLGNKLRNRLGNGCEQWKLIPSKSMESTSLSLRKIFLNLSHWSNHLKKTFGAKLLWRFLEIFVRKSWWGKLVVWWTQKLAYCHAQLDLHRFWNSSGSKLSVFFDELVLRIKGWFLFSSWESRNSKDALSDIARNSLVTSEKWLDSTEPIS